MRSAMVGLLLIFAVLVMGPQLRADDTPDPPPVVTRAEFDSVVKRLDRLEAKVDTTAPTVKESLTVGTVVEPVSFIVPTGHHAHQLADGSTLIHADSNRGNAAAHAGVVSFGGEKWPKTAVAGQVVPSESTANPSELQTFAVQTAWTESRPTFKEKRGLFGGLFKSKAKVCRGGNCP